MLRGRAAAIVVLSVLMSGCLSPGGVGGDNPDPLASTPLVSILDAPFPARIGTSNATSDPHVTTTPDGKPLLRSSGTLREKAERLILGSVGANPSRVEAKPHLGGVVTWLDYLDAVGYLVHDRTADWAKYPVGTNIARGENVGASHETRLPPSSHFSGASGVGLEFSDAGRTWPASWGYAGKTHVEVHGHDGAGGIRREVWDGWWTQAASSALVNDARIAVFLKDDSGRVALALVDPSTFGKDGARNPSTKIAYRGQWGTDWDTFLLAQAPYWTVEHGQRVMGLGLFLLSYASGSGRAALDRFDLRGEAATLAPVWEAQWSPGWKHFHRAFPNGWGLEYFAWHAPSGRVVWDRLNADTLEVELAAEGLWTHERPPIFGYGFPDVWSNERGTGRFLTLRTDPTGHGSALYSVTYEIAR